MAKISAASDHTQNQHIVIFNSIQDDIFAGWKHAYARTKVISSSTSVRILAQ